MKTRFIGTAPRPHSSTKSRPSLSRSFLEDPLHAPVKKSRVHRPKLFGGDQDDNEDLEFLPADQSSAASPIFKMSRSASASKQKGPVALLNKRVPSVSIFGPSHRKSDGMKTLRSLSRGSNASNNELNHTASLDQPMRVALPFASRETHSMKGKRAAAQTISGSSNINSFASSGKSSFTSVSNISAAASCPNPGFATGSPLKPPGDQKFSFGSNDSRSKKSVISRFSYTSKAGYAPQRGTKENQDSLILCPKFMGDRNFHLFGVCDGHGIMGRKASELAAKRLPEILAAKFKQLSFASPIENRPPATIMETISQAVVETHQNMIKAPFDTQLSGTTCCCVLFIGRTLYCINVGDSRAVMVNSNNRASPLTRDHKPETPDEEARIIASGGKVQPFYDQKSKEFYGPMRVYNLKGELPGLAMSRSLGDQISKRFGVVASPEITKYQLSPPDDSYIILGSDGIWEYISNQAAADLTKAGIAESNPQNSVTRLMKEALKVWRQQGQAVDDISSIVLQLQGN